MMNGLAFIPLMLIIAAGVTATAAIISATYEIGSEPATSSTDPIEITATAVANTPWHDIYDLFFSGLFGILVWFSRYVVLPFLNFIATLAAGTSIHFHEYVAYLVLAIIVAFAIWKKKDQIWEFVTSKLLVLIIFMTAVFVLGVVLAFLKVI